MFKVKVQTKFGVLFVLCLVNYCVPGQMTQHPLGGYRREGKSREIFSQNGE